jgi:hypothetical protein
VSSDDDDGIGTLKNIGRRKKRQLNGQLHTGGHKLGDGS